MYDLKDLYISNKYLVYDFDYVLILILIIRFIWQHYIGLVKEDI